jgi:hypothetical protein
MKVIFLDIEGVLQSKNSTIRLTNFDAKKILSQTPFGAKHLQLLEEIDIPSDVKKNNPFRFIILLLSPA